MEKAIEMIKDLYDNIASIRYELEDIDTNLTELGEMLDYKDNNSIKDIDNFKRELKREGLYSRKLEDFIEEYMHYYNH